MVQYPSNGGGYRELPSDAPPPRLCLIQKQDSSQEYGFNLHAEKKGQFIGTVDLGSPADSAGLKQGDRIFAVNGASIVGVPHKTVVSWIKSDPLKCEMLVVSDDDFQWYTEHNIPIDMSLPNIIRVCKEFYEESILSSPSVSEKNTRHIVRIIKSYESQNAPRLYCTSIELKPPGSLESTSLTSCSESTQSSMRSTPEQEYYNSKKKQPIGSKLGGGGPGKTTPMQLPPPRLCRLQKHSLTDEFGFNLHAEKGKGHFIGSVDKGGIGDKAGLVLGQRIVGVNDKLIYPDTPHKDVVTLIKKDPLCTELLVVSEEVDRCYTENGALFSFDNAIRYNSDPANISRSSIGDQKRENMETHEIHHIEPEFVETQHVTPDSYETLNRETDFSDDIQQTTTLSTTQVLTVSQPYIPTEEDHKITDDLIDQIFKDVPLVPVKGLDTFESDENSSSSLTKRNEFEGDSFRPLPTYQTNNPIKESSYSSSSSSEIRPLTTIQREPSPKPVPLVTPPINNTRSALSSNNNSHSASTSNRASSANGNVKNFDIFTMSAKDAQRAISRPKKDPRKEQLTNEQKLRMIEDL